MSEATHAWRRAPVPAAALIAITAIWATAPAQAKSSQVTEETAAALWEVPHDCADGATVPATLLVQSTIDFESPAKEDADPTVRVQFLAVCPDGTSFSWIAPAVPADITTQKNLKGVHASGFGIARDNLGQSHAVFFDVSWTGVGPVETTVHGPGSKRQPRVATATRRVTFDGDLLVNGPANHSTRPAPFIRVDTEK